MASGVDASKAKGGSFGLSYPMLVKSNYTAWSLKMKAVMQAHGVWTAVEPSDEKAVVDEKADKVAVAMIYQGIAEDMLLSVADRKTAKETWEAIKTLCQGADKVKKARIQTLKTEFEALSMRESEPLDDFYMKLNGLVTNIRALGETMQESYVVKKMLRAVPTRFLQITSTIEQFSDLETMSVEEAMGALKAHDERTRGKSEVHEGQLMLTDEEWRKRDGKEEKLLFTREEWLRRNQGNGEGNSSTPKTRVPYDKSRVKCFNCHLYGHYAAECRKPKRNRDRRQEANIAEMIDDEPALLMTKCEKDGKNLMFLDETDVRPRLLLSKQDVKSDSNVWYLDNGASNHMSGQRSKFCVLDEGITGRVRFGDGSTVEIKGRGSVMLKCRDGKERVLNEVYFIPNLRNNIISIGQLSEDGNKVVIRGEYMWVYEKEGKLLMKIKRSQNRLYKVIIETGLSECMLSRLDCVSKLWHARLGHVNYQALVHMFKENMVKGLPRVAQPREVCTGCLMSKQARKSVPTSASFSASKQLELVHGDLCGPINPETASGNKYVFLLVDDFSRVMWAYLLKSKGEAFEAFKKFRVLVEDGDERRIKTFRTDRGGKFMSKEFKEYCEQAGIARQYTAPYTPQQNGVVERRNRTMMEMARSYLKEMNMPAMLWGEAVRHTIYVLNRLPTRALTGLTPYEAWSGTRPDISHIRVFGCKAHMKIPSQKVKKLDDRSVCVVNLGKEPGSKAYRLYNPVEGQVCVSKDVVFEETKPWPWESLGKGETDCEIFFDLESTMHQEDGESHVERSAISENEEQMPTTPQTNTAESRLNPDDYDDSGEPKRIRPLGDIYNDTEEIITEEELYLMGVEEPANFREASKDRNWKRAMTAELESIEKNHTWSLTELPPGEKVIGLKWIFKLKKDAEGNIIKYKARLVAKGYTQEHGIDFDEVYAPVTRLETVRLLLAMAAKNKWQVHHMDVKTAFLNGEVKENVFVAQPDGYEKEGKEHLVYKLRKALYGLRQAPRAWYAKLNQCLTELGFKRCPYENAVYTKGEGDQCLIIAVYVDDILITGARVESIGEFKKQMGDKFDMTDLGKLSYYLGIEVEQGEHCIKLKQSGYATKILEKAGMGGCNPTKFPMDPKECVSKDEQGKAIDTTMFKSLVGGLRYLVNTRPDIAYPVGVISRYMERPTMVHLNAAKRIMRYIKGTIHFGLVYTRCSGNNFITGFSDSDMGGSFDDRRSTGGMAYYLNESLISWVSQKQRCVALSTCEAEFMAATAAACQGIWLRNVLNQITAGDVGPVTLYIDNKSAIDLAKNPVFHGRSKHIDVRYHFIRECVERGDIIVKYVSSNKQRADCLTKALTTVKFEQMRGLLGVKELSGKV